MGYHPQTPRNPRGGGRPPGPRPDLQRFPGILGRQRIAWDRMKAQAKFRHEEFNLSWQEFQEVWEGQWHLRGRAVDDLCLTRCDWWGPWSRDNVELCLRKEHFRRQAQHRAQTLRTLQGR